MGQQPAVIGLMPPRMVALHRIMTPPAWPFRSQGVALLTEHERLDRSVALLTEHERLVRSKLGILHWADRSAERPMRCWAGWLGGTFEFPHLVHMCLYVERVHSLFRPSICCLCSNWG